jgi:hypothetical protein
VLESTPDNVTFFAPRKEAMGRAMMLVIKAIAVPENSGMFSVKTPEFQGFQYGRPQSQPKRIILDLFSDDGCVEFIFFKHDTAAASNVSKDSAVTISQPEINIVIQSLRKLSDHPSTGSITSPENKKNSRS